MSTEQLLKTPLHALHLELGARMVPFAGYDMPVQYPLGVMKEHQHTREQAGLFDVSHMGQIRLTGADAAKALEALVPVDIIDLPVGMQRYAMFTNEQGGILDDLMVANLGNDELFLVVNAACKDQDLAHLRKHLSAHCQIQPLFEDRPARPARPGCSQGAATPGGASGEHDLYAICPGDLTGRGLLRQPLGLYRRRRF